MTDTSPEAKSALFTRLLAGTQVPEFQLRTDAAHFIDAVTAERDALAQRVAGFAADRLALHHANDCADVAMARVAELEAELRQSACDAVSYLGQLHDAQGQAVAAEAENQRLRELLSRAPSALNDAFAAGMEEREGGSARRQGKYLESVDQLRADIRAALAQGDKT